LLDKDDEAADERPANNSLTSNTTFNGDAVLTDHDRRNREDGALYSPSTYSRRGYGKSTAFFF
jgi:hypothetical protein